MLLSTPPTNLDYHWKGDTTHVTGIPPGARRTPSNTPISGKPEVTPSEVAKAWNRHGERSVVRGGVRKGDRDAGWYLSFGPYSDHDSHIHVTASGKVLLKTPHSAGPGKVAHIDRSYTHLKNLAGETADEVVESLEHWASRRRANELFEAEDLPADAYLGMTFHGKGKSGRR